MKQSPENGSNYTYYGLVHCRVLIEEVYRRLSKALHPQTTVPWTLAHVTKAYSEGWVARADE